MLLIGRGLDLKCKTKLLQKMVVFGKKVGYDVEVGSVCGFEGISNIFKIVIVARWLSWLERRPVTAEVVGSIPIRVAFHN